MREYVNTDSVIGENELIDKIIDGSLTELVDDRITVIGRVALAGTVLTKAWFPKVKTLSNNAFHLSYDLKDTWFPEVEEIQANAFHTCKNSLKQLDFPKLKRITGANIVSGCTALKAFVLRNTEQMCAMQNAGAFSGSPIANGTAYIYVPRALIEQYKAATNWSTLAATTFRVLEDFTVDGTTTGELDETKI